MPARNTIRQYTEQAIYHVYNRGLNKMEIFKDDEDYKIFLYYLFIYTAPLADILIKYPELNIKLQKHNLSDEVEILTYCLMPNHFHMLIQQSTKDGITKLLKQLTNAYTRYFNTKYDRSGPLFQGRYKAGHIPTDELLLHTSRYIHLNPFVAGITSNIRNDRWTSFNDYMKPQTSSFVHTKLILSFFKSPKEYEVFVLNHKDYARRLNLIKHLLLE